MLRSPAWRALTLTARRVIDRVEIELADHGGTDNGKLPITYDDFERYGLHRHAIGPAIREAEALGFLVVTERGRAGNAEWRKPNLFRLTIRETSHAAPTNEWDRIKTDEEAEQLARAARAARPTKKMKSQWRRSPIPSAGKHHRKYEIDSTETATTVHSAKTVTTLDISGEGSRSAPEGSAVASEPSRIAVIDAIIGSRGCSRVEAVEIFDSIPEAPPRSDECPP